MDLFQGGNSGEFSLYQLLRLRESHFSTKKSLKQNVKFQTPGGSWLSLPPPLSDAHARDALSKFETQKCWQEWTAFSLTHVELREGAVRVSLEDKASILPRWCQQRMPTDDK